MADHSTFRSTRPGDTYRRPDKSIRQNVGVDETDPLAELARLIGKNDPYAEFGLSDAHADDRHAQDGHPHDDHSHDDYPQAQEQHDPHAGLVRADQHYHSPEQPPQEPDYDEGFEMPPAAHAVARELPLTYDRPLEARPGQHQSAYRAGQFEQEPEQVAYPATQAYDPQYDHAAPEADADNYAAFDQYEDQTYDDPPRARRRGGLTTALALIGCAVLGTAGAYAYRSYSSQPAGSQAPPVITVDTATPTKIVPAPSGDAQSGRGMQDRLANAGKEQVVSKQEEPVAVKDLGPQATPRAVPAAPPAPSASLPAGSAAPAPNEPRKVRTLAIRPDGSDGSARDGGSPAAQPAPAPRSGPLSLDPQAAPAPAPAPRTRTAVIPAAPAPRSEAAGSAGVLVQLASQKTEAEATASFRSLQAKFPNELGGKHPIVRRADLGAKGVYYRTMVGPFASAQEANEFCASYKAAGGHCVVPSH